MNPVVEKIDEGNHSKEYMKIKLIYKNNLKSKIRRQEIGTFIKKLNIYSY